jgi:phosphoribosylglycinamide formyltransferase-1
MKYTNKKKWAFLCSGIGNNIIDVIEEYKNHSEIKYNFEISLIIYDNSEFLAADVAKNINIDVLKISRESFVNPNEHQKKISYEIEKKEIDFIFLLNYKFLIREEMLNKFQNRIINIHPSLFPSFIATKTSIQDAIAYGVKITGITTHIIDNEYDKGIILHQTPIKIKSDSTFETIYPKFRKKGKTIILKTMQTVSNSKL